MNAAMTMPFGRYEGLTLPEVPTSYLSWALATVRLSHRLREAVRAELAGRGVSLQGHPPPTRRRCRKCGEVELRLSWQRFKNGTLHLRSECPKCGRFLGHVPQTKATLALVPICATSDTSCLCGP